MGDFQYTVWALPSPVDSGRLCTPLQVCIDMGIQTFHEALVLNCYSSVLFLVKLSQPALSWKYCFSNLHLLSYTEIKNLVISYFACPFYPHLYKYRNKRQEVIQFKLYFANLWHYFHSDNPTGLYSATVLCVLTHFLYSFPFNVIFALDLMIMLSFVLK